MKRYAPWIGFSLLAVVFVLALGNILTRSQFQRDPATRVLRIGHWLIHDGMREAFAQAIANYEKLHPGVRVEQNAIPLKTWFAWQRAQWTSGNTPDIMQLGKGTSDTELARYYMPLTDQVDQPNPYNTGTPLAGLPWRETFVDGLASGMTYSVSLAENYGIPAQVNTIRLYYNRELFRTITGRDSAADLSLDEFLALGAPVRAYAAGLTHPIVPLSICGPYAEALFDQISSSLTQEQSIDSPSHTLRADGILFASDWLSGRWTLDRTPNIRATLRLWSELTALAQPGYAQLQREDAHFTFVTGHALFLYAGSWDYSGIIQQARFPVGIIRFPLPVPNQGRYGAWTLGAPSEAESGLEAVMAISRDSRHPELALDFLRFLTSHATAVKFTQASRRISAVADIPVPEELQPVRPVTHGPVGGLTISQRWLPGGNATLAFNQNLHLLRPTPDSSDEAAVTAFVNAVNTRWPAAIRRDLAHAERDRQRGLRASDTRVFFANTDADVDLVFETSLGLEIQLARIRSAQAISK